MQAEAMRVAVTGSSGFVGTALVDALSERGHRVDGWSRRDNGFELDLDEGQLEAAIARWQAALRGVDVLVHTAARVHQMREREVDAVLYRRVNADAALMLARAAVAAGVRRLIFISTAKVYGEGRRGAYREDETPAPQGAYAESKWIAECLLREFCAEHAIALTILRPPLVYGDGVGGNFESLQRLARSGWPLPFASVRNRRSMLALDNLIDAIAVCCEAEIAPAGVFNIADAEPYGLADVIRVIRVAERRASNLWPAPIWLLRSVLTLLGQGRTADRMLGDFELDLTHSTAHLHWSPRCSMRDVMQRTQ